MCHGKGRGGRRGTGAARGETEGTKGNSRRNRSRVRRRKGGDSEGKTGMCETSRKPQREERPEGGRAVEQSGKEHAREDKQTQNKGRQGTAASAMADAQTTQRTQKREKRGEAK